MAAENLTLGAGCCTLKRRAGRDNRNTLVLGRNPGQSDPERLFLSVEIRRGGNAPRIPLFTIGNETDMARKKPVGNAEFISFDVLYEDGASEILGGLDGDEPAKELIEEQDRKIAELSGRPRGPIKAIMRSGK
jgi:hypothetical protein